MTTTNTFSLRAALLIWLFEISKPIYRAIFKRNSKAWTITLNQLSYFPTNTLGEQLYQFLTTHQFQIEPKLESHDVSHVLLGYDTHVMGEICLQYFYIGSGKKSLYAIGTVILGGLIMPEYWSEYKQAFNRGSTALNFSKWDFEHLLREDVEQLRALIFSKKATQNLFI